MINFIKVYILLLFYALCNFFYGKIFILFPQESAILFKVNLLQLTETMFIFKTGNLLGTFLSFIPFNRKKILIFSLIILIIINTFVGFYSKSQEYFSLLRIIFGLILGVIPGIYTQFISKEKDEGSHNNKYISMIFNSNIIILPIGLFFIFLIEIEYWFSIMNFFLIIHIFYLFKCKLHHITNNNILQVKEIINFNSIQNNYKYYIIYGNFIVLLMFFAICALMSNPYMINSFLPDKIYKLLFHILKNDKLLHQIYQQIPIIIGMIAFLLQNKLNKIYLLLITLCSLMINYFFSSKTILMINNGLIYSMYVVIGPFICSYLKKIISLVYIYKISLIIILHKLFLGRIINTFLLDKDYYFWIFIPFVIICLLLLLIFEKYKHNI